MHRDDEKIMLRRARQTVLAMVQAVAGLPAQAQEGDIAAGHAFAREACNACHIVEAKQHAPA